jgi:hypothetical protein
MIANTRTLSPRTPWPVFGADLDARMHQQFTQDPSAGYNLSRWLQENVEQVGGV